MGNPKKCAHKWRIKVNLFLDIPGALAHRLSKGRLRLKDVVVEGAGWPTALMYCEKCGEQIRGC